MSLSVLIDGSSHSGMYRAQCDCGYDWTGRGTAVGGLRWSPLPAMAEVAVHFKLDHPGRDVVIRLSDRAKLWLVGYLKYSEVSRTRSALQGRLPDA